MRLTPEEYENFGSATNRIQLQIAVRDAEDTWGQVRDILVAILPRIDLSLGANPVLMTNTLNPR